MSLFYFGIRTRAVINDTPKLFGMIRRILRRALDTGDTEFATSAKGAVVGTIHLAPRMPTTALNSPPLCLSMTKGCFNLLLGMKSPQHTFSCTYDITA